MNDLIQQLEAWDGKHIDLLDQIYSYNHHDPGFFNKLITITASHSNLQAATTWIIKHHYDRGNALNELQIQELLNALPLLDDWESQLHLLQLLPKFEISETNFIIIDDFVKQSLKSENKFVRAWAYQGFYELFKYAPDYRNELEALCQRAMQTESAAIKSKVRKILAKL